METSPSGEKPLPEAGCPQRPVGTAERGVKILPHLPDSAHFTEAQERRGPEEMSASSVLSSSVTVG